MPQAGEVLGDRYRLDDRIAAGGMGEVWRATDTVLGRDVAVKTLHAGRAGDPGFQTRFKHEARAMAVLHHPGVADVYDYGQSGPDAYIVMARVNGEALNNRIAERGRLTATETMSIVAQVGRALQAAHDAGIVHRDVKPGNLIIKPDGTVVLVDFGVARSAESAELTGVKEVVGTALYIAPEQVSKEHTGPSADIYALGCVAYHCLTGHPPFLGESAIAVALQHVQDEPPPLPDDVPAGVRALVVAAMAKSPADRFPSAAAMADAAQHALGGGGLGDTTAVLAATAPVRPRTGTGTAVLPAVPADDRAPEGGPPPGRKRALIASAAAAVLLGVILAVVAAVNPGILPGSTPPAESATTGPSPAQSKVSPTGTRRTTRTTAPGAGQGTESTRTAEPTETATPEPSETPTEDETTATTEPAETATAAPEETETATDNSGSGSGSGAEEDNSGSGSGGGEEESSGNEGEG
jgi:serine/threonine-protein kinase